MKQITVHVNDHPGNTRMSITFAQADFDLIDAEWESSDETLIALDSLAPAFRGYTKWSLLRTEHYRVLIQRTMLVMEALSASERADAENHVVKTFNAMLLRMLRKIEETTGSTIEFMRIHRLTAKDIVFDFAATMNMNFGPPPPAPGLEQVEDARTFKLIVSPDETP